MEGLCFDKPMMLSGIDRTTEERDGAIVEVVTLVLDDKCVEFSENPEDGYRSSHNGPVFVSRSVSNTFTPIGVMVTTIATGIDRWANSSDVYRFMAVDSELVVLEVGTDDIDDYYPYWVCNFSAEALGPA